MIGKDRICSAFGSDVYNSHIVRGQLVELQSNVTSQLSVLSVCCVAKNRIQFDTERSLFSFKAKMVNPFKAVWEYYEKTGVRRDLPWLKRMMVEIPHVPIGTAVMVVCIAGSFAYMEFGYNAGIGFQERYTVLRPGDPRLAKFREDVINADKLSGN